MKNLFLLLAAALLLTACGTKGTTPQVEGLYTYAHAFNYDLHGTHLDVQETGTMDFRPDGTALDSARQMYVAILPEGDTQTFVFNYISPSRWQLEGDTLHFAGIKEAFRMTVIEGDASPLSQEIIQVVGGSIDYAYKFHLDSLTATKMQWSFTYRDGNSDSWEFYR